MRFFKHTALVFLLASLPLAQAARAAEKVWSGFVLATNQEQPKELAPELVKFGAQLKCVFGYNQFELIGQHEEVMDSAFERWMIPSKDFSLLVNSSKLEAGGYRMKLQFFQEKKLLAEMNARLAGQNLLFIRGPLYAKGQLIIVLAVK
jgi:hypothetical protein